MNGGRVLDVALAAVGLSVFGPVLAVLGAAILLEDGGPVLFRQERVGQHRRPFTVFKLRSMRDGKVTRVGAWIRRTGIDETAQFLCVLRGDMSVVGPRPLTADDVHRLGWGEPEFDVRFATPPGITGLAQLFAVPGVASSVALDRAYVRDARAWLDLQLVAWSFACNVVGKARVRGWLSTHRYGRLARAAVGCERGLHGDSAGSRR
jgi:lipopolysaccharide/colanic/teichoic acid biosynthesis glycosyltransferase